MEELSITCNASIEKVDSTPTARKNVCNSEGGQVGYGRKEKRAQSANMEHTESRCPEPSDANLSAVDCNPLAIQNTLDSSSEDGAQLNASFHMDKDQTPILRVHSTSQLVLGAIVGLLHGEIRMCQLLQDKQCWGHLVLVWSTMVPW